MRLTAIVVLVFAAAAAACSQPQSEPGSAGQQAAGAATGGTSGAGALTDAGGAGNAGGGFGATALAPVSGSTPGGAPGAPGTAGAPAFVEVTIPAGTTLPVVLETAVASDTSTVEQAVVARLSSAVEVNGAAAVPANSTLHGVVTAVERAGKVKGRAHLALRFSELAPAGGSERYQLQSAPISRTAAATKGKDAMKVGGGALGGAIVGGIIGGKKGAAVGTAAGGGAGGAVVMSTRGDEVRLAAGTKLSVKLSEPLVVRVAAQ